MNSTLPDWALQMDQLGADATPFLFVIDFERLSPLVIPLSEISDHCIRYEINVDTSANNINRGQPVPLEKFPVSFDEYTRGFNKVLKAIQAGDTYLLNLCYATKLSGVNSLEKIFEEVRAPFKLLFQTKFVVYSPERFVSIEDDIIKTFPMKGTIDASIPRAEDLLLGDLKEQEEHATVVDLLRNDLSIVAREVTVEKYRYITEIKTAEKTLLQCSSGISGRLNEPYVNRPGSIFHAILPAGSVTGAPKKKTVELIKAIEPEPRGYYTGVFGVFDGVKLDSGVMIRMIEQRGDEFYYRSGGGITYRSDVGQEYQEMVDKVYVALG